MIHKSLIRLNFTSILQINTFYFVVLLSKIQIFWCEIRIFFKKSEISGFGTFISNGLISSKKCSILMVDPALNSWRSELFNAVFDVITALFPVDLSRKNLGDPLTVCFRRVPPGYLRTRLFFFCIIVSFKTGAFSHKLKDFWRNNPIFPVFGR